MSRDLITRKRVSRETTFSGIVPSRDGNLIVIEWFADDPLGTLYIDRKNGSVATIDISEPGGAGRMSIRNQGDVVGVRFVPLGSSEIVVRSEENR